MSGKKDGILLLKHRLSDAQHERLINFLKSESLHFEILSPPYDEQRMQALRDRAGAIVRREKYHGKEQ